MNTGAAIARFLAPGRINLGAHLGGVLGWEPPVGPTFITVRPLNLVSRPNRDSNPSENDTISLDLH